MRAGKILKTVKHLTMGRICSRQASVLTVLFHKCLLCRRNFWKMGMGGKYASLKGACGSFCMKKVNAELIRIGSRQRKAEGWGETGDRDGGRERDRACPNAGSCVPAAERQAHCIPLIGLTTSYSKRWHFSILNWRNLRNSNCGKDSLTFPWCMCAQLCLTLCGPMECSLPGSSVHGIFQARILDWIAIPYSGDLPNPGTEPMSLASPALAGRFFTTSATWEPFVPEAGQKTLTWRGALLWEERNNLIAKDGAGGGEWLRGIWTLC